VNPPTKLCPVITDTKTVILSLMEPKVKAMLERTRMKLKNRRPAY
jgi:hypothetical protein